MPLRLDTAHFGVRDKRTEGIQLSQKHKTRKLASIASWRHSINKARRRNHKPTVQSRSASTSFETSACAPSVASRITGGAVESRQPCGRRCRYHGHVQRVIMNHWSEGGSREPPPPKAKNESCGRKHILTCARAKKKNNTVGRKQTTERHTSMTDKEGQRPDKQTNTKPRQKQERDTAENHHPEAGTWSPTRPEDPLTDPVERFKIARAFSL